jgi:hypothetical protein
MQPFSNVCQKEHETPNGAEIDDAIVMQPRCGCRRVQILQKRKNASILVRCGKQPAVAALSQALGPPDPQSNRAHARHSCGGVSHIWTNGFDNREQKGQKKERIHRKRPIQRRWKSSGNRQRRMDGRVDNSSQPVKPGSGVLRCNRRRIFLEEQNRPGALACLHPYLLFAGCLPLFRYPSRSAKKPAVKDCSVGVEFLRASLCEMLCLWLHLFTNIRCAVLVSSYFGLLSSVFL